MQSNWKSLESHKNCYFAGAIPASLGNLTKVTQVFLQSNNLTGQIPSSLSNLKDLTHIDLSYNNFEGRIPDFLTNLTKLTQVDLSYNQLTSQIGEYKVIGNLLNLIKISILQDQYQHQLETSQKLLNFSSNLTTSLARFHHHFQT